MSGRPSWGAKQPSAAGSQRLVSRKVAGLPAGMLRSPPNVMPTVSGSWREGALERDRAVGDRAAPGPSVIVHGSLVKNPDSMSVTVVRSMSYRKVVVPLIE